MDRLILGIRAQSADRIIPELQSLSPGDRVPDSPDAVVSYFEAAEMATSQTLVLISHTHPLQAGAMLGGIKTREGSRSIDTAPGHATLPDRTAAGEHGSRTADRSAQPFK